MFKWFVDGNQNRTPDYAGSRLSKHRHDTEDENDEWFMRVYGGAWNGLDNVNNDSATYYSGHRVGLFVACLDWEGNAPYHQAEGSLY